MSPISITFAIVLFIIVLFIWGRVPVVLVALGTFAPRLDKASNSVKSQLVAAFLANRLGLDLFASAPEA